MAIELSGLAARLKAGIDKAAAEKEAAARREAEEAARRQAAREETLAAQREMLAALEALADSVGHFHVSTGELWVQLVFEGRGLRFVATRHDEEPTDHVRVEGAAGTSTVVAAGHHLTRDEEGEWEVVLAEEHGPRRLPVELGLEELLAQVFQIEPVEASAAPSPRSAPVEAAAPASKGEARSAAGSATTARRRRRREEPASPPGSGLKPLKGPFG